MSELFAEIITISDELLEGKTTYSGTAYIVRNLLKLGFKIQRETTLANSIEFLSEGLAEALHCNPLVMAIGLDSNSLKAAAHIFGSNWISDESSAYPSEALVLSSEESKFPAVIFSEGNRTLILLPEELKEIFEIQVAPFLIKHFRLPPAGLEKSFEESIYQFFLQNNLTISAAESCTGGLLAARLTSVPGISSCFLGSIVSYSNDLKTSLLGVSKELIEKKGAVSAEVAEAMAEGVLWLTKSSFSVSITGTAGPSGGTPEKPIGTIFYALKQAGKPAYVNRLQLAGSRESIMNQTVQLILEDLLGKLKN